MPDTQPPPATEPKQNLLKTCPDCGGILQLAQPTWISVVDVAARRPNAAERPHWQCHICGYRD